MLSGNSLRQIVHTRSASVYQAAKLVAALLSVAGVTAGLAEGSGSLPPGLWLTSPAGWLPRTGISSGTLCSVIEYGLLLPLYVCLCQLLCCGSVVGRHCCAYMAAVCVCCRYRPCADCRWRRQSWRGPRNARLPLKRTSESPVSVLAF